MKGQGNGSTLLTFAALASAAWLGGAWAVPAQAADEAVQARPPSLEAIVGTPTCLSEKEAELATLIDTYRKEHGLLPLARSKSLTLVAKWHAFDLEVNQAAKLKGESGQPCGFHSWSDKGGDRWSKLCFSADAAGAGKMWLKPKEITGGKYRGSGYENVYYNSDKKKVLPARILDLWKQRTDESDIILQEGPWAIVALKTIGIGISDHYAVVWFGEEIDKEGDVAACSGGPASK